MSWRVVVVSSNAKVDFKMDYLVVHDYFSREELEQLYKMIGYQKMNVLLLENHAFEKPDPRENVVLLDSDLCELHLEAGENVR